jgi:hypothetical protein
MYKHSDGMFYAFIILIAFLACGPKNCKCDCEREGGVQIKIGEYRLWHDAADTNQKKK